MREARRKEKKKRKSRRYMINYLLTQWEGWTRNVLNTLDYNAWTSLCSVYTLWPQTKFPVQPSHSVNKWILLFVKNWCCQLSDCKRIKKNSELSYVNPTLAPQIWASWIAITPLAWNKEIHIMTIILWAW